MKAKVDVQMEGGIRKVKGGGSLKAWGLDLDLSLTIFGASALEQRESRENKVEVLKCVVAHFQYSPLTALTHFSPILELLKL